MTLQLKNRVRGTTTTTGTGAYTVGAAPTGFQAFSSLTSGRELYYCCKLDTNWEVGLGTVTVAGTTTLSRDLVLDSSSDGAAINWGAGTKEIFVVAVGQVLEAFRYAGSGVEATLASATIATPLPLASGGTAAATAGAARTSLGLGSLAVASTINNSNWSGTVLSVANGGTGSATAAEARTALGLAIGTNVQAYSANLTAIAALAVTDSNIIVGNGSTWVAETGATARTSLGLGTIATQAASAVAITGGAITGITDLAVADGGTGASTAANARTNLGLGTIATQAASAVAITGGTVTGITDLAVADGGTGASNATNARTNLGLGTAATRNITVSTSAPSGGADGDVWLRYVP
jgi:hypothetical protein